MFSKLNRSQDGRGIVSAYMCMRPECLWPLLITYYRTPFEKAQDPLGLGGYSLAVSAAAVAAAAAASLLLPLSFLLPSPYTARPALTAFIVSIG